MPEGLRNIFSQANASGTRSTALQPLQWTLAILVAGLSICLFHDAAEWLLFTVVIFIGICLLAMLGTYLYLLNTNPDSLRSEKFNLSKMAIEKGLVGDSLQGIINPDDVADNSLPSPKIKDEGDRQ